MSSGKITFIVILLFLNTINHVNAQLKDVDDWFNEPDKSYWLAIEKFILEHHPETRDLNWVIRFNIGDETLWSVFINPGYVPEGVPSFGGKWTYYLKTGEVEENYYFIDLAYEQGPYFLITENILGTIGSILGLFLSLIC